MSQVGTGVELARVSGIPTRTRPKRHLGAEAHSEAAPPEGGAARVRRQTPAGMRAGSTTDASTGAAGRGPRPLRTVGMRAGAVLPWVM